MLQAMAESVAEKGYAHTSVADVLKRGRVSRETFYQHFSGKQDCFLTVLDRSAQVLEQFFEEGLSRDEGPWSRFDRALEIYLTTLAAEPAFARVFFLESYAAGPEAQRKRFAVQDRFVQSLMTNFADEPAWQRLPDPGFAARMMVGAVSQLVAAELVHGRDGELPTLREPMIQLLVGLVGGGADPARSAASE
ncbi:TetR family transcriptional regulator [Actinoallomurus iriomotensis]|uniref:TetR family transcriptional regulator n=1 Tax=Actinoallomurus iriomotensis TaxID=478107 RepID=A0A9W6VTC4_9ACTN|nr:TetR family transcriptional regulator [Actinoallomurus iriomotensis]